MSRPSSPLCRTVPLLAALGLLAAAPAAGAKLTIRTAAPVVSVRVPASDSVGTVFAESQRLSTQCRSGETSLAPGILEASRHIVAQSFGPSAVGAFATGAPGKATLRLQLLCAKGAAITHKRVEGKSRPTGSALTTTARVGCGSGKFAIGAPLSQEFAPGFGRFASKPTAAGGWEVTVENVPSSFPIQQATPAYADVACAPRSALKALVIEQRSTTALASGRVANLTVACDGGRRPVGWGVDQRPVTSSFRAGDDGWVLPIVSRAAFSASAMTFAFTTPAGVTPSTGTDVTQTAYVLCAKPS